MIKTIQNKIFLKQPTENLNFLQIEELLISKLKPKKELDLKQLSYELMNYGHHFYKNNSVFEHIRAEISKNLEQTEVFSKESNLILNLMELNKQLLKKNNIKSCFKYYTAQLITNWILLSLNSNLIDNTCIEKNGILFSRYDCIKKFSNLIFLYLFVYDINFSDLLKNWRDLKHLSFTVFMILEDLNFLIKHIRRFKVGKIVKNKKTKSAETYTKTYIYYSLKNFQLSDNEIDFEIHLNPPTQKLIKNVYFLGGLHYSTYTKIFKTNVRSNKIFDLYDKKFIDKISSLKFCIDFEFYYVIKKLICNELGIEKNISEFIINEIRNNNLTLFHKTLLNINKDDFINCKKDFQKDYSKYLLYYIFDKIEYKFEHVNNFYLASTFDFRGRVYTKSCISPIGPKIFRYLYFYGFYNEEELKNITTININNNLKNILKECLIFKFFDKIDLTDQIQLIYSYWCIFEIGKIFKNKLIKKNNGCFNNEDLVKHGSEIISLITNKEFHLNFEELLEYNYILSGLKNLNENKFKKLILYKDATASGLQILTVILGAKNEEIEENCNLQSLTTWYDTYYYVIKLFEKENLNNLNLLLSNSNYKDYIDRKFLKSSIMTYLYGAGKKTCLNYYLGNLPKNLSQEVGREIFNLFYNFLNNLFKGDSFFKISIDSIILEAKKKFENKEQIYITTTDNSKVYLDYFMLISYRLDRINKNQINNNAVDENEIDKNAVDKNEIDKNVVDKNEIDKNVVDKNDRNTIVFTKLSKFPDEQKTFTSLLANIVHSLDALLLRQIIYKLDYPIITIHDSYAIDILNVPKLISVANKSINEIGYSFNDVIPKYSKNLTNKSNKIYYSFYILI